MLAYRKVFPYDLVVMLGDNIYGGETPNDYQKKFENPYKPLLDAGVKFELSSGGTTTIPTNASTSRLT